MTRDTQVINVFSRKDEGLHGAVWYSHAVMPGEDVGTAARRLIAKSRIWKHAIWVAQFVVDSKRCRLRVRPAAFQTDRPLDFSQDFRRFTGIDFRADSLAGLSGF